MDANVTAVNNGSSRHLIYTFLILATALLPFLGVPDFHTRGEAREAIVVESMISSGNWVLPEAYNDALPSKPPLFHWLAAVASMIRGEVDEFTVRLPSALVSLSAAAFFVACLRALFTAKQSILFVVLLAFSFEWLRASVAARVDMVHAGFLSSGLLSGFFALQSDRLRWWCLTTILLALATLGKGPVGIVLPAAALGIWIVLSRERRVARMSKLALCLGAALVLSSSWYVAAYIQAPNVFFEKFWDENVARFSGTMDDQSHRHSFLYLWGVFLIGTLPWSPFALWLVATRRPRSVTAVKATWEQAVPVVRFSFVCAASILFFYCLPASKRGVYLLAAYPFFAIQGALLTDRYFTASGLRRLLVVGCCVAVLAQAFTIPTYLAPQTSERPIAEHLKMQQHSNNRIYSIGFEFYGAAFYFGRPFLRMEGPGPDGLERHPARYDYIVCFDSDLPTLEERARRDGIGLRLLDEVRVGTRIARIFQVGSRGREGIERMKEATLRDNIIKKLHQTGDISEGRIGKPSS